jgi:glycine oxidase
MKTEATYNGDLRIAIAGAGLLGRLLAWRLLRQGCEVHLFEKGALDPSPSAAHTAAAMISPMSEVVVSERAIYDLGVEALALWPQWLEELRLEAGFQVHYAAPGSLVVAHPADVAELEQFHRDLEFHLGRDNRAVWLDRRDLAEREPDLAGQFEHALYLPDEAYLDNRQLLVCLLQEIERLGGRVQAHCEVRFTPAARIDGQALRGYHYIIDCRGVGARDDQPGVRGVRGEVLWVRTEEVTLRHPVRLMHPRYKLYVVPRPDHRFIIGATEIESEDRSPVSVQSMLELCSALYTLNPAFAEARILELDANLRPAYWHNLPTVETAAVGTDIGESQRIVRVNGLYRHGYLLAPPLVEQALARLGDSLAQDSSDTNGVYGHHQH